jgi:hypothetical protein
VTDWPLPPYVEPRGPSGDDDAVVRAFLRADVAPHSDRLHVEGPVLLADRDVSLGLRLGPVADAGEVTAPALPGRTVLLRTDLPADLAPVRQVVESVLTDAGLTVLDEDSPLGIAVGLQLVGLRMSSWDLWGTDIDEAFADLRAAAMGGSGDVLLGGGGP